MVDKAAPTDYPPWAISRHSTSALSGPKVSGIVRRHGKNFASVVGYCDGVLEMCGEGVSVIFISSELDEIIRCSNRIVVMRDRKKVGEVNGEGCTQQTLLNIIANGMQEDATA